MTRQTGSDEAEVKEIVERFLAAIGRYDVDAVATLVIGGEPRRHNIDYFTLMNIEGSWRFISASYVSKPID